MPTKEQREIIGPAWELQSAMVSVERQWRQASPRLAELVGMARKTLLIVVNAELMHRGGEPLKEMGDVR